MTDIDWDERPTDKHCWLEAVNYECSNESGWYILHGLEWVGASRALWHSDLEGEVFVVHCKSDEIEPYKPVVGDKINLISNDSQIDSTFDVEFIAQSHGAVFIVEDGEPEMYFLVTYAIEPSTGKADFIEKYKSAIYGREGSHQDVIAGLLYKNGARFTEGKDE